MTTEIIDIVEAFGAPLTEPQAMTALSALLVLMVLDVLLGFCGALKGHNVQSNKLRSGGWHKVGELGLVCIADVADTMLLGGIDLGYGAPICTAIICYLVLNELVSCAENCCVLNPDLKGSGIFKILNVAVNNEANNEERTDANATD